jgi:membrane protein implicated in regulation of membrane protease activity
LTTTALIETSDGSGNYFYSLQDLQSISSSSSIVCFVWKALAVDEPHLSVFWWIVIIFVVVVAIVLTTYLAIFITRRQRRKRQQQQQQQQTFEYIGGTSSVEESTTFPKSSLTTE